MFCHPAASIAFRLLRGFKAMIPCVLPRKSASVDSYVGSFDFGHPNEAGICKAHQLIGTCEYFSNSLNTASGSSANR